MRKILPFIWMIAIYTLVAGTEGRDPTPPPGLAEWALHEGRNAAIHALAYGIQVWLIARAVAFPPAPARGQVAVLLGLGVALGVGHEALQAIRRADYTALSGLWDILIDTLGAAAGWSVHRWQALARQPLN